MPAVLAAFPRALPAAEPHLHLSGSASPQTVVGLAARHPTPLGAAEAGA